MRNMGIDEEQNGTGYFQQLITIVKGHIARYQAHFIEIAAAMGNPAPGWSNRWIDGFRQLVDLKTLQL